MRTCLGLIRECLIRLCKWHGLNFTNELLNVETVDLLANKVCDSIRIGTSCHRLTGHNLNIIELQLTYLKSIECRSHFNLLETTGRVDCIYNLKLKEAGNEQQSEHSEYSVPRPRDGSHWPGRILVLI